MAHTYTTWTNDLATGNGIIDDQHKKLIDALNALYDAHHSGLGHEEIERTMDFLINYTFMHFNDEEDLMVKYRYTDYVRHKALHDGFRGVAEGMLKKLIQGAPTEEFIVSVYSTIGQWVLNHIRGEDTKAAAFIKGS